VFLVQSELYQHALQVLFSSSFAIFTNQLIIHILVEQFEVQGLRTHDQSRLILFEGLVEKYLVPGIQCGNLLDAICK